MKIKCDWKLVSGRLICTDDGISLSRSHSIVEKSEQRSARR